MPHGRVIQDHLVANAAPVRENPQFLVEWLSSNKFSAGVEVRPGTWKVALSFQRPFVADPVSILLSFGTSGQAVHGSYGIVFMSAVGGIWFISRLF